MQTPTTTTILDKQNEQKILMLENNKLKAEKDILKREVSELAEAKSMLMNEVVGGVKISDLKDIVSNNIKNKISDDVKLLEEKKDTLEKQENRLQNNIKNFLIEDKSLLEKINLSKENLKKLNLDLVDSREKLNKEIKILTIEIDKNNKKLKDLKDKNKTEQELLNIQKKDIAEKISFILQEEVKLAKKKSDLNIYESRLREKYLQLMPEMEIVL